MECIIPGMNIKVLGKALQALSKIGDELFIEIREEKLTLNTLNSTRTVCAQFHVLDTFFSCYEVNNQILKNTNKILTFKIHLKVILPLFKGNLEKKLDFFKIEYECDSDFLVLKMKYKSDEIIMIHNLRLMDSEILPSFEDISNPINKIAASSEFCSQLLTTFNSTDDEITLEVTRNKVIVRNYCPGAPSRPKMMRSQISVNSTEFTAYKITKETSVNFSLKPLRTIINFAEVFTLTMEIDFETDGKPLTMSLNSPTFALNFIVSTLNSDSNSLVSTPETPVPASRNKARGDVNSDLALALDSEDWDNDEMQNSLEDLVKKSSKNKNSPLVEKAKVVFRRCFDQTFHDTILGPVLMEDSDPE